jgi:putative transposase
MRRDHYQQTGLCLTCFDQQKQLTTARKDEFYGEVPIKALRSALGRVDLAFKAFFRRVKAGDTPGYPRFKNKDRYSSFSIWRCKVVDNYVKIPKLGLVKFHRYRDFSGKILEMKVRRKCNRWSLSITCDIGPAPEKIVPNSDIGIDLGLTHFAFLSNGRNISNPRFFRKAEVMLARRQQSLELKKRGSRSHQRQKLLVQKANAKIHNQRLDFARKTASKLFNEFDMVCYEDLNIAGMMKGKFSKSIADAGWRMLIATLQSKAEKAGKWNVAVDSRGTSQRCNRCGNVVPKKIWDRIHTCSCGEHLPRDHNSALEVLRLGRSQVYSQSLN